MALRTIGRAVRKRNEIKSRQNKRVNAFRAEMNKLAREQAESQARKNHWTNIFRRQGRGPLFNALGILDCNLMSLSIHGTTVNIGIMQFFKAQVNPAEPPPL